MAVISGLLARLGFVRIRGYGLILTAEGRILSTRHAILDDGLGGKIVGWNDGDLATMELERWHPGTAVPSIAKPVTLPPMRPPVAPPKPVQALVIAPVRAPSPVQVAHPGPADEDEWEWEIAVARARAAADPIPKAEEIHEEIFETWEATPPPRKLVAPPAKPPVPPGKTVIPVPPLSSRPTLTRPMPAVEPVRREPVRRYPRATSRHEETIRTHAAPPANDDLTAPSIVLPPAPVASSARRASAKQR